MKPPSGIVGIVLAAGLSRRMGGDLPKQLLPFEGEPLVRRAARRALASRLAEVLVVVGHRGGDALAALAGLPVRVVDNPAFAEGKAASIRAGLAALSPQAAGALFIPCDQPHLDASVLDLLIAAHERNPGAVIVPVHRGRRGAPVLFPRRLFAALARLSGDQGGRDLLRRDRPEALVGVELADPRALEDLDEP